MDHYAGAQSQPIAVTLMRSKVLGNVVFSFLLKKMLRPVLDKNGCDCREHDVT